MQSASLDQKWNANAALLSIKVSTCNACAAWEFAIFAVSPKFAPQDASESDDEILMINLVVYLSSMLGIKDEAFDWVNKAV